MKKNSRVRRTFTKEFKEEVIKLITEDGIPMTEVAKNLDVHEGLLCMKKGSLIHSPPYGSLTSSGRGSDDVRGGSLAT